MVPAQKRFEADKPATLDLILWLIYNGELPQRQRLAQLGLQHSPPLHGFLHLLSKYDSLIATFGFGLLERQGGVAKHRFCVCAIRRRNADAHGRVDHFPVDEVGPTQNVEERFGQCRCVLFLGEKHELSTGTASEMGILIAGLSCNSFSDPADKAAGNFVPVTFGEVTEIVDIDFKDERSRRLPE